VPSIRARPKSRFEGAVAAPHASAARAGADAYSYGGNAIDAALAAAAVLAVVYPHQCSIGGDLFAVVDTGRGEIWSVNGSGAAASAIDVTDFRRRYNEVPDSGPDSVTVPGIVAGWQTIHQLGARLPWPRLLDAAIVAASNGCTVSRSLARGIRFRLPQLLRDPGMRALFLHDDLPLEFGAPLRQPALAATLKRLAREGLQDFYQGAIAADLAHGLERLGSSIARQDLAAHHSELVPALQLDYGDVRLHTSPPNSPGFVLLETVAALDALALPIDPVGPNARSLLHAILVAGEDRDRHLGDPHRTHPPWAELFGRDALGKRLRARNEAAAHAVACGSEPVHGDTVAICTLDSEGTAVSLIQSVFQTLGSGLLEPGTGIILHNRARGFSLAPGAPNELAPRARPAHTLTPLLIGRGCGTLAAVGSMGGRAQPQILAGLLPAILDPGMSLEGALAAPRWVVGARDMGFERPTVAIEAHASQELDSVLNIPAVDRARIPQGDERVGHAQAVRRTHSGRLEAAADPRSDGAAEVCSIP
jgi:oxamate amidohydrolase